MWGVQGAVTSCIISVRQTRACSKVRPLPIDYSQPIFLNRTNSPTHSDTITLSTTK